MERRDFLKYATFSGVAGLAALSSLESGILAAEMPQSERPNILWLSMEDIAPHLGCYGESYATTPNIDQLAAEGVRYTHAFAIGASCSPSRSSIYTGMYASTIGTQDQRSRVTLPDFLHFFPYYLRQAGYFCTNRWKEDFNVTPLRDTWDEIGEQAHWRHRKPGQPFFSVFNGEECHSSVSGMPREKALKERLFLLSKDEFHDPDKAPVPPQYPNTPGMREVIAQTSDAITQVDHHIGDLIRALKEDGLYEDTIIVCWSDQGGYWHGKTLLYDESVHVPLIVRFPEKYSHLAPSDPGTVCDRIVELIDLASTTLDMAGVPIPDYMQGEIFLGPNAAAPRKYAVSIRDRFGFSHEFSRTLRDDRYRYIRNFYPHWPYGWWYGIVPTSGGSGPAATHIPSAPQSPESMPDILMWKGMKPAEELYDAVNDPDMVHNLADSPEHRQIRDSLRKKLFEWMIETKDLGLIYPLELEERAAGSPPYEIGLRCKNFAELLETADLSRLGKEVLPELLKRMKNPDAAVRYWAVTSLTTLGASDEQTLTVLRAALEDTSLSVRLAAAEALCRLNRPEEAIPVLKEGLEHPENSELARTRASGIIARLDDAGRLKLKPLYAPLEEAWFYQLENGWNQMLYNKAFYGVKDIR